MEADDGADPANFGWSAHPPPGSQPDDPIEKVGIGPRLMMPEYGVDLPLWDDDGPIETDPEVVHRELGLSYNLIRALTTWGREWDDVNSKAVADDTRPVQPLPKGWSKDHRRRGRALFARLKREIAPRFDVRSSP